MMSTWILKTGRVLASCSLVTLSGMFLVPIAPSFAQSTTVLSTMKPLRTLTVSGRGSESIPTSISIIRLGVEAQGETAEAVQKQVAQRSNNLVTFLKSRGVDQLETTGINLTPTYNYTGTQQPTLTGYQASNSVSFRVDNTKAGAIIDEAVKSGASRIDGISFMATPEATTAAQKQALRKATQDAQAQAQAVLAALNFTQKEIIGIQVGPASAPPRVFLETANLMARGKADAPSPVMGGEQTVEATVTLEISY